MLVDLTVQEIEERLEEFFESGGSQPESYYEIKYGSEGKIPGLGDVKLVDKYGGEGQGDDYWVVFSVSDGDVTRLFRKSGWYASYAGGEFDSDLEEVRAQQKVVTVYE